MTKEKNVCSGKRVSCIEHLLCFVRCNIPTQCIALLAQIVDKFVLAKRYIRSTEVIPGCKGEYREKV